MTDPALVEKICRRICKNNGQDPDKRVHAGMPSNLKKHEYVWETHKGPVQRYLQIRQAANEELE